MARIEYRPSTRSRGFAPAEVSQSNISRMREESNRVVQNMRERRNAEISNRQEILRSMKEDEAYYDKVRQREFNIRSQNTKQEGLQIQYDAEALQQQYKRQMEETEQVFSTLSKFSAAAGKKLEEIEQKKFDEDVLKGYQLRMMEGPNGPSAIQQRDSEYELQEQNEVFNASLDESEAKGADPVALSQARTMTPGMQYGYNKANVQFTVQNKYQSFIEDKLQNDSQTQIQVGDDVFTPVDARGSRARTAAVTQYFIEQFLRENNLFGLKAEFLGSGLDYINKVNQQIISREGKLEQDNRYSVQEDQLATMLVQDPENFQQNALVAFRAWARNPTLKYKGALDKFEKMASAIGPDGEFLFTDDQVMNVDLKGDGSTFAETWPVRAGRIQKARLAAITRARQEQLTADRISFEEDTKRIMQGIIEDPTAANVNAAKEFFVQNYGGRIPEILNKFGAQFTNEARNKEQMDADFEALAAKGILSQANVEAAFEVNFQMGRKFQQLLQEQNAKYNTGAFKEQNKSLEAVARNINGITGDSRTTPSAAFLSSAMQAEFRRRVDQLVLGGMDIQTASLQVGPQLESEVRTGMFDPKSKWYRAVDKNNKTLATYPNLSKGLASTATQALRRQEEVASNISKYKGKSLSTPGAIFNGKELTALVEDYNTGTFSIPQRAIWAAGKLNTQPMAVINAQLKAAGMKELQPPNSIQSVNKTVSPSFQKLLYKTPSINRSTRALGSVNNFDPSVIPGGYGELIQQASKTNGVNPSFIAALMEIESSFNPQSISPTGAVGLMQIQPDAHPGYMGGADPAANIDYGTKYYKQLLDQFGDPVLAAGAYNAGPGRMQQHLRDGLPLPEETRNHMKKFAARMYKYGGGRETLARPELHRSGFQVVQYVSGDPAIRGMNTSSIIYDPHGHGGQAYHNHYEFQTKEQALAAKKKFEKNGFRVTSFIRAGDPGAHGRGYAIDVAPPLDLPRTDAAEAEWSAKANQLIGYNPLNR